MFDTRHDVLVGDGGDRWRTGVALAALVLAAAVAMSCGGDPDAIAGATTTSPGGTTTMPEPLAALAAVEPTETDRFATSGKCDQCHLADATGPLHDADGADISPAGLWRSSMMALAARDPYYLSVFSDELARHPAAKSDIEAVCTRCHAPAGSVEHEPKGGHVTFDDLVAGAGPEANLARDGVTCTLCHQIGDVGLGAPASFTGGFTVGYDRELYGPHGGPKTDPMQFFVEYTPTYAEHLATSEVCATCHTVVVPTLGPDGAPTGGDFLEQAPYLEWLSSDFAPATACRDCHLPARDEADAPIESPLAKYPTGLPAREPFGKHLFVGGNAYMLGLLADNVEWTGSGLAAAELADAAARSVLHLESAAALSITSAELVGGAYVVEVAVENHAGHKLPTGYPSRRMWLHVRALDAQGATLFESGRWDDRGALVDGAGARLDAAGTIVPHRDTIESDGEVQIWEAVAVDTAGKPTHLALESARYAKDDRIPPAGFAPSADWKDWIAPIGADDDPSFGAGGDRVTYRIAGGGKVARVEVELVYQSVPPAVLDALAAVATGAAVRFTKMAAQRPPKPVVVAETQVEP